MALPSSSNATKIIYQRNQDDGLYYDIIGKQEIIKTLPDKGQKIANALGDNLNVTNEGDIIYQNGTLKIGSPLVILIEWYLSKNSARERPLDYKLFEKLIRESKINIPKNWIKNHEQ